VACEAVRYCLGPQRSHTDPASASPLLAAVTRLPDRLLRVAPDHSQYEPMGLVGLMALEGCTNCLCRERLCSRSRFIPDSPLAVDRLGVNRRKAFPHPQRAGSRSFQELPVAGLN